jgi:phosphate acyltransferase
MLERIRADHITRNPQSILEVALIASKLVFLTAFAHIVAFMVEKILKMQKKTSSNEFLPHIGIDLMGSDSDSSFIVTSLLPVLDSLKGSAYFVLFGTEECAKLVPTSSHISYEIATESIEMEDHPLWASRKKKDSSLTLGIQALQKKSIHAFISMGNTGAILTTARTQLKTLHSITHPALLALLPSKKGTVAVLDVGANADYKSTHLTEFTAMGIAYQKTQGIEKPTVGLLNIGKEPLKGPTELKQAYQQLEKLSNSHSYPFFLGNIEGRDAFDGKADILVTGGFAGNIFLKTAEGMAQFLLGQLPTASSVKPLENRLDYRKYPGATLCGVNGIIIKCHGEAKIQAITESIHCAIELAKKDFIEKIRTEVSSFFIEK